MWHALGARPDLKNQLPLSVQRALIWHVVSTSLPRAETIPRFQLLQFLITPEVNIQSFHLFRLTSDRVSILFFCPSSVSGSVCVRKGACGLCSLQSTEGGGVEELILWRDGELIVQVSQCATKLYPLSPSILCVIRHVSS